MLKVTDANGCDLYNSTNLTQPERDDWNMNGNYNTNPATQFIGTSDYKDLVFKTNSIERLNINADGSVKINGTLNANDSITLNNKLQIGYRAAQNGEPETMSFGKAPVILNPVFSLCTTPPLNWPANYQFNGMLQLWGDATHNNVTKRNVMEVGFDGANAIIEAAGITPFPYGNNLLLNAYCGHDVGVGNFTSGDLYANHNLILRGSMKFENSLTPGILRVDANGNVSSTTSTYGIDLWGTDPSNSNNIRNKNIGGIGIGKYPESMLDVQGEGRFENAAGTPTTGITSIGFYSDATYTAGYVNASADLWLNYFTNHNVTLGGNNSKVGIGTVNPQEMLQIGELFTFHSGGSKVIGYNHFYNGNSNRIDPSLPSATIGFDVTGGISFKTAPTESGNTVISAWTNALTINNDGKIGIGISTASNWDGNYNLYVKNGIRSEKLKLDIASAAGWGDCVFGKDYDLKNLNELSDYIKNNNHLPDVPSAVEIVKNGMDVQDILKLQMIKIEELTLYVIQLKSEIDNLKKN